MKLPVKLTRQRVLVMVMLASAAASLLGSGLADRLRAAVQPFLAPLGDAGTYLATALKDHVSKVTAKRLTPAEAQRIIDDNKELTGQLIALEEKLAENLRQQETKRSLLFGPMKDFPCELIPARVVGAESLPYGASRVVNAGRSQGAEPGIPVTTRRLLTDRSKALFPRLATVTASALVGRLTDTGAFTARLQLVTDAGFRTRARILRVIDPRHPRQVTIITQGSATVQKLTPANNYPIDVEARGDGAGGLVVRDVKGYHNVRAGDWLVTSGDDAFLPAAIRIGQVAQVEDQTDHPGFVTLRAAPHADLSALRQVYIVVPLSALPGGPGQAGEG